MSQSRRYIFPAKNRIKKRRDFVSIRNRGRRLKTPHFYIHVLSENGGLRLGVTVSKRVGNAPVRNRVKRLLREFFRLNYDKLPAKVDISIVARHNAGLLSLAEVTDELNVLFGLALDGEGHV